MKRACLITLGFAGLLAFPCLVLAGDESEAAKEILKKVDEAAKALKSVSYHAEFFAQGPQADQISRVEGDVKLKRGKSGMVDSLLGNATNPFRANGKVTRPGAEAPVSFDVATDGRQAYKIDTAAKEYLYGDMPEAGRLLADGSRLMMQEYIHPKPFSDEINAESATIEDEKDIGGVKCDVIYVVYSSGQGEARWYFGKEDRLPHRVDRFIAERSTDSEKFYTVLQVKNLEIDPEFKKGDFRLKAPEGYKEKEFDGGAPEEERPTLLAVGTTAPDWELATPDGTKVSLKSLRGNVVVLDFWATWCGPCKMAMPGIQKLHEKYKDKSVKVIGMNCWESARKAKADPAEMMKKKNYTYGLLLKADDVADKYQVQGIPTFYVIGPDGKIAYAGVYGIGKEKELEQAVEKALRAQS